MSSNSSKPAVVPARAVHSPSGSSSFPPPITTSACPSRVQNILHEHLLVPIAATLLVRRPDRLPRGLGNLSPVERLLEQVDLLLVRAMYERVEELRQPRI